MNNRHQILFNQLKSYRSYILEILDNVTKEEADVIPKGFRNNIRWNLGHIYLDQYLWIQALTKEKTLETEPFNSWFGFGTSPAVFTSETPTFESLKKLLAQQPVKIEEMYGHRIEDEYPPTEMGMHTIEQVLIRTIFHEGMHLQAIIDIKKCI